MERFTPIITPVQVDFDPFVLSAIERTAPTTEAQREVFIASSMTREANLAYIESVSLELDGELDASAMERSIQLLGVRHEALRSVLDPEGLRMLVLESTSLPFRYIDLSDHEPHAQRDELERIAAGDMSTPFDLIHGPLFRSLLIRTSSRTHLLRLTGHHVFCDGWSLGVLMADIARFYNALAAGREPVLAPAPRFSDHAIAQLDFARSPEHGEVERYWLDLFKGALPRIELPTDRQRSTRKSFKGQRLDLELAHATTARLRELATRTGSSFVTTLLTAFELFIYKLTGDSDLCIGLPAAGQSDSGMKDLVGHCVNLMALRSRVDEERSFREHLMQRRSALLDAYDHQRYTFGTLVRKLNVPRIPGRIPLVPVVFNIDMDLDDEVAFDGLYHRLISNPRQYENFELFLNATGNRDRLVLEWSYNTDLFDASTIRTWMDQFTDLIERSIDHPDATIADLVSGEDLGSERLMPRPEWQGRQVDYPHETGVNQLFDAVVSDHGDRVALVHGDRQLTYRELQQRVFSITAQLQEQGVGPGDRVALCCDRHFAMVAAQLAILRSGAAFVPLDPTYPEDRVRLLLEDTCPKVLLTERLMAGKLPSHERILFLDGPPQKVPMAGPVPRDLPDSPAYIMYTSGSTGIPKGVVVPHRAIVRLVRNQNYAPFGPDLVITQLSNVSFDASTFEIWGALLNGGKLVLQPQAKPTLAEVTETIQRHGVNTLFITTGLFNVLVDEHVEKLKGLKCVLTGGEVMSLPHIRKALRVLGPGVLNNIYGPTENTTFSCFQPVNDEAVIGKQVPIGRPINNTFLYVLDEQLRTVPVGMKGELYCGGDGVALGYWQRPELTAERFLPDPFRGGDAHMYRTGDLVKWRPDGTIEFIGRADDQVKVRGFRIEPGEIENAISAVGGVRDRIVVLRRDLPGDQQLVAYIVPDHFDPERDKEARDRFLHHIDIQLRERLPSYMVPAFIVALPALPLNTNGKVDRKALPLPEPRGSQMKARHVAPRDSTERTLASIWSRALGVDTIGVHDNFFDLGGHSLIGIQLLSQVDRQLGRQLSLRSLFEAPTVAEFAALLEKERPHLPWSNLSLVQPKGDQVPLFCVHGDEANHFIPRYLGNERPFYAFFHQGEDGRRLRFTTVESIARHFLDELRDARPRGPYLLCGYSFGGIVAYEMAKQLHAAGEEVPVLVLFDTYAPHLHAEAVRSDAHFYDPLKKRVFRGLVNAMFARDMVLPPKLRHFHIIDTYDQAVLRYDPGTYEGPLTVFKAQGSWGPDDMGWGNMAKGGLDVRVVPGDHSSMIKEPHVKRMVMHLTSVIGGREAARTLEAM